MPTITIPTMTTSLVYKNNDYDCDSEKKKTDRIKTEYLKQSTTTITTYKDKQQQYNGDRNVPILLLMRV